VSISPDMPRALCNNPPWPQAHPCDYFRAYWHERQSGFRWGPIYRINSDAGAACTL